MYSSIKLHRAKMMEEDGDWPGCLSADPSMDNTPVETEPTSAICFTAGPDSLRDCARVSTRPPKSCDVAGDAV